MSVTVRLSERDPAGLHSRENLEKLEMFLEALEIVTAVSFSMNELTGLEHSVIVNQERMEVSLVYSIPQSSQNKMGMMESSDKFRMEAQKIFSSFQQSRKELAQKGIEVEAKVTQIETLELPS
jgi:hypothetical protein